MNELVPISTEEVNTVEDNRISLGSLSTIIPIFFLLFFVKPTSQSKKVFSSILSENGILSNLNLNKDTFDTLDKGIRTVKKVGPYLPETTISTLNTILPSVEKIVKVIGFLDFISNHKPYEPIIASPGASESKDRTNNIVNVLKNDLPQESAKTIGPLLDIVANIDKFKGMLELLGSLSQSSEKQSNQSGNQIENMMKALSPMLGGKDEKAPDKMKDMLQMMEVMKILTSDDKKDTKKNENNEKKESN